ncbi:membrane protein insertase YidC [Candidatus Parcubacteria bacterium]|nr:membrane protein insertase YidC [Candidatus Parcubacteria bacterium]
MNFFINIFNIVLYQPLFNGLILIYQYVPGQDFGVAVIILTIIIRLLLYPSSLQSIKSQKALSELQPKIQEIQRKYKENREKMAKEVMELYKKEKINPIAGFLPLLIQLPLLIALFLVFKSFENGFDPNEFEMLYSFVSSPADLNPIFLGAINLANKGSLFLALLAGAAQFFQTKMLTSQAKQPQKKSSDFAQIMQKQMMYIFPIFTVYICWSLPSAIALYWLTTALFSVGQQHIALKKQTQHD